MKKFLFSFILVLASLAMYAQIDAGTGLRQVSPEPKPNTDLFGWSRKLVALEYLRPLPTPGTRQIITRVGKTWGIANLDTILIGETVMQSSILSDNVIDTCDASGLVTVDLDIATTDYQIFVSHISSADLQSAVTLKTDSSFVVQFRSGTTDTVSNLVPVVFDYLIWKN